MMFDPFDMITQSPLTISDIDPFDIRIELITSQTKTRTMNFSITTTLFSSFDCKLTPKRSEMLVLGYCAAYGYCEMTMDLIRIIILFFNSLLYWKISPHHHAWSLTSERAGFQDYDCYEPPFPIRWKFDRSDYFDMSSIIFDDHYVRGTIEERIQRGFLGYSHASNIIPSPNEFNISLTVKENKVVSLELNSEHDDIQLIVIGIRIFCVENGKQIEKILVTKNNEQHKICSYQQTDRIFPFINNEQHKICSYQQTDRIFPFINNEQHKICSYQQTEESDETLDYLAIGDESMVGKNIGFDAEIYHILYTDGNYWCKNPYSWFCDIIDGHTFVRDGLSQKHLNYFNSGCFKINDTYYYLYDSYTARRDFFSFVFHYCPEFMQFPYDVLLLDGRQTGVTCTPTPLSEFYNRRTYLLEKRAMVESVAIADKKALKRSVYTRMSKHKKNLKKKQWNDYYGSQCRNQYRNKKQKYKYHRW
eukprot:65668_1